jgi:hypothetical protein
MVEIRSDWSAEARPVLGGCIVSGELATLAVDVSPYVPATVGAYGTAVLVRVRDEAADATVGLGRRIMHRIFGTRSPGDVPEAVADLAADPGDPDLQAALRVEIRRILATDPALVSEVRSMLAEAPTVAVTASGERSIAAYVITGIASTGDDTTIER